MRALLNTPGEAAAELARLPVLRLLRATAAQLLTASASTLQPLTLDGCSEQQARAVAYALHTLQAEISAIGGGGGGGGGGDVPSHVLAWLGATQAHFAAREANGFGDVRRASGDVTGAGGLQRRAEQMLTEQSSAAPAAAATAAPVAPAFRLNLSSSATAAEAAKQSEAKQSEAEAEAGGGTRDLARDLVATMSDYGGSTVIHPQAAGVGGLPGTVLSGGRISGVAPLLGAHRRTSAERRTSASMSEGGGEGEGGHDMTRSYDASPYGATTLQRAIGKGTYGLVYKGEAPDGDAVAVKVMALSSETAEEVRKEIVMMRGCLCANIVTYLDAFIKPHDGLAKLWADP